MKGLMDMWFWIGLIIVLLVFSLLLYFQQAGQRLVEPSIVPAVIIARRKK